MAKRSRKKAAARPSARRAQKKAKSSGNARKPTAERRRADPATLRLRTYQPSFTVNDLEKSRRFYTDVLGFIVGERWNDDKGVLRGLMLKAGACELGLSQDDFAKGRDRKKGEGVRLWCTTAQDIDALASRIKAAGVRLTEEPRNMEWGGRSLSVDDPDGYHITVYREA
jgi:catechol 2,3-dioxygenase-like lactoylglutathione lyase family enzyme